MTRPRLYIDIETRSRVDLRAANPYRYVQDPDFGILMAAYALDDEPVQVVFGNEAALDIPRLWDGDAVVRVAHNAPFERICFSEAARRDPGLAEFVVDGYLPPEQWHDTMAVAAELGYPQGLEQLARALGGEQKDTAGTALVNFFCKPNRKGEFNRPEDHPEKWAAFVEYCRQDVVTLRDVDRKLGDFPTEMERRVYMVDQRINDRGVKVDLELARRAVDAAETNRMTQELEVSALTGVANPGSNDQLLAWLRQSGLKVTNLQAATVTRLLEKDTLTPVQRRVLELRQELALVASKKFEAALEGVSEDGRLRGQFRFFGAHTGRWAGRGVQLHNLPRLGFKEVAHEQAAILDLKLGLGADADTLKRLVRPLLVGPFTVVDYSAIEARVIAWLADEEWALEAFRAGRDIYVETAERMSTKTNRLTRTQGKIAVLALGYNGGVNSLRAMGGEGTDEELQLLVTQWRKANPNIVDLWAEIQEAFRSGGEAGARLRVETDGTDRALVLPSGRAIVYHGCEWKWTDTKYGRRLQASFQNPKKPGMRVYTYGGRLSENATQAVARDVLAEALVRLEDRGYRVAGHVHDEILVEGEHSVEEVAAVMCEPPAWADGLPIGGAGFTCVRYRKE